MSHLKRSVERDRRDDEKKMNNIYFYVLSTTIKCHGCGGCTSCVSDLCLSLWFCIKHTYKKTSLLFDIENFPRYFSSRDDNQKEFKLLKHFSYNNNKKKDINSCEVFLKNYGVCST